MPAQVAIVHGWSDSSKSFYGLRDFLIATGYPATQIWLSDYVSMSDEVRFEDVAKRMHTVIEAALAEGRLTKPFDLVVHSTGGLVAREWLSRYFTDGKDAPVKRVVMLAPANFGSKLASMGKSMIGRVAKGWDNWLQTGDEMLTGLELASAYQWDLARRDVLDAEGVGGPTPYGPDKVWPFVIVGSRGYRDGLHAIVNENGSDGTVRPAAANLNAIGMTIDFAKSGPPKVSGWRWRAGMRFPLAVLPDRDHTTIHQPETDSGAHGELSTRLGMLIVDALRCDTPERYAELAREWDNLSEETVRLSRDADLLAKVFNGNPPEAQALHQYMQIVLYVRDDQGRPVDDYFLEFFSPEQAGEADAVYFHSNVLDDAHVNAAQASRRCLFVDHTDLMTGFYGTIDDPLKRVLAVSLSAAGLGPNVHYFDSTEAGAKGSIIVHQDSVDRREKVGDACLWRNTTHLVEIIIPRQPISSVFSMT